MANHAPNTICLSFMLLSLGISLGCDSNINSSGQKIANMQAQYNKKLIEVRGAHSVVKRFNDLFPGAIHNIEGFVGQDPKWYSLALLHDRYIVTIKVSLSDPEMKDFIFTRISQMISRVW